MAEQSAEKCDRSRLLAFWAAQSGQSLIFTQVAQTIVTITNKGNLSARFMRKHVQFLKSNGPETESSRRESRQRNDL